MRWSCQGSVHSWRHSRRELTQPGLDEIRIPSERAFRSRERALRDGLEIYRLVFEALAALRARGG
jgi:LDH2 family malate/lactate/ureidoglycolate dehydrogenase